MKKTTRKLMSLLVAMAIVCSMVPAAMASSLGGGSWGDLQDFYCYYLGIHDLEYDYVNQNYHYEACRNCDHYRYTAHTDDCDCDVDSSCDHDWQYQYAGSYYGDDMHWVWCDNSGCEYGYSNRELEECYGTVCVCDGYSINSDGLYVEQSDNMTNNTYAAGDRIWLEVEASMWDGSTDVSSQYVFVFKWYGDYIYNSETTSGDSSYVYLDTSETSCSVYCTVEAYYNGSRVATEEVVWNATSTSALTAEATVYNTSSGYQFDQYDDEGHDSVEEQIADAIYALDSDYELEYVTFSNVSVSGKGALSANRNTEYYYYSYYNSDELLGDVIFYPESGYEGTVEFGFTAYYYDTNYSYNYNNLSAASGTIVFDVKGGAQGIDILYTAKTGDTVDLDEDDFVEFWSDAYPSGTLEYVQFTVVSTGYLYDYYDGGRNYWTDVESARTLCYLAPTSRQIGLNDLTYVPGRNTVSATISFTAHGTTGNRTGARTADANGTIAILYADKETQAISYTAANTAVMLAGSDFDAVYKQTTGSTTRNPSYTIQFLDVPTHGSLYANYGTNNRGQITGTKLTESNIAAKFSNTGTSANSINKMAYVPGTSGTGDTIRYLVYSGNSALYLGTINFGVEKLEVSYYCGKLGVTFKAQDFSGLANGVLTSASYITFGTPSSGTLYKNYANGSGTKVTSYDTFTATTVSYAGSTSLNNVTFIPAANFSGTVEIPFAAYTALGAQVTGTVKIGVAKDFSDVPTKHWAYNYIARLTAQGIVAGYTDGTFGPTRQLTYGEALKLVMEAAGYPEQAKTGTHWASGYLTAAYRDGLVTSSSIDLNSAISRTAVAEIAARALGLSSASRVNTGIVGPTDTTNGYVYALYNAGIINGDNSTGVNRYNGSNTINRAEISKIICLVNDYYVAHH